MTLQTKYFGEVDYTADEVITFPNAILGFENEREFLLMPFEGSHGNLLCLQSVATPSLAFLMMDPFCLCQDYHPALQQAELDFFGVSGIEELCFYVLCVAKKPVADSTVNLKCPIVVHPGTRTAGQVILETDAYHMRHPLADFSRTEEGVPC